MEAAAIWGLGWPRACHLGHRCWLGDPIKAGEWMGRREGERERERERALISTYTWHFLLAYRRHAASMMRLDAWIMRNPMIRHTVLT